MLVFGNSTNARQGQAQVSYLAGFLGHQDAYLLVIPGRKPILFVQYFNHVPNANRLAQAEVRWGGARSIDSVTDELASSGIARIGLVGPMPYQDRDRLADRIPDVTLVDASRRFQRLRLVKSQEEIVWIREAARITDASLDALVQTARPPARELDLQAAAAWAAITAGGQPHFLYLSSTSMAAPDRIVPQQDLTDRRLQPGDVVFFELSSSLGGYSGQVLRSLAIDAPLTPRYQQLHDLAWEAFHAIAASIKPGAIAGDITAAASIIDQRGFSVCDDVVHGYGGGYLPPVLRTPGTSHGPMPDFTFEEDMTVVIQPNVVTLDGRAGVQVGELVHVTRGGVARLHAAPQRLLP